MASVSLLAQGAVIQSLEVDGLNIVQSFNTAQQYRDLNKCYFGETIGRVANRISNATITSLNGRAYTLAQNNGRNNLHGGVVGWGKKEWSEETPAQSPRHVPGVDGLTHARTVVYKLRSENGDEGFPGTLDVRVSYTTGLQKQEDGRDVTVLAMEYEAKLVGGADETAINMTNHSYFNLTGGPSIEGTIITLSTNQYLPVDAGGIPTAGPTSFPGITANEPFTLGAVKPDIDDCFIINTSPQSVPIDTRALPLQLNLAAYHPSSRVHLQVLSTEPAFQFYTGRYIDVPAVDGLPARGPRSGFCCEPGRYVNAVNEKEWKSQVILKKGETFGARTVYRAWKE